MTHSATSTSTPRFPWSIATPALVSLALFGTRLALLRHLPERDGLRLALAGALAVAALWLVLAITRHARSLDEFEQRTQGLALGFAFPVGLAGTFVLGLLTSEGVITRVDPMDVPLLLVSAYLGGLALARRRFQ